MAGSRQFSSLTPSKGSRQGGHSGPGFVLELCGWRGAGGVPSGAWRQVGRQTAAGGLSRYGCFWRGGAPQRSTGLCEPIGRAPRGRAERGVCGSKGLLRPWEALILRQWRSLFPLGTPHRACWWGQPVLVPIPTKPQTRMAIISVQQEIANCQAAGGPAALFSGTRRIWTPAA